ncbi:bifunctional glutamate N-acetyltransferase/amino-acid acetyltransferase ArgJ [Salinisphaera sp. Q1T1-3]|uniref:bifunctional glutamate N-acetyltransferase/amino-acid acetyltransferase ArgJ n=1 Tax=Salinisphaera sp. Q1T1-3 TaxID=2321229 RepID=UPI000E7415B4|nr:bifunctional glutamate N-acetyltransferase/amino-acid acetyltransferase ArgJ [Salinisphaera sp. Q1T1-3]RJS92202.1 bifunctional glutamate N-acetyltransferase/amino-acid acetyltransferase ArgJ [Salinisphaera sp. Q1T1-3]
MAVNLEAPASLAPVAGTHWSTIGAAIKAPDRDDIAVLWLDAGTRTTGLFTRNAFAAAPVQIARRHLTATAPRALLVNSGNANAGTGLAGEQDGLKLCEQIADAAGLEAAEVLPFSTGVIGQRLPLSRMMPAVGQLSADRPDSGWLAAARAIMTTDTVPKGVSREIALGAGQRVRLTGIAKGSGMIRPDMATMLAFLATDADIPEADLHEALVVANQRSFNSITVDGDTSTNDAVTLSATGQSASLDASQPGWPAFVDALVEVMTELATAIVRDAEGATRFIRIAVAGAGDEAEARAVGFTVAQSPLFKTAAFAGDPNWGRILAAVGRAPIEALAIDRVDIALDDVAIVAGGQPRPDYIESEAAAVMARPEFTVHVDLGRGQAATTIYTSDLSYEYVRINAEYRS